MHEESLLPFNWEINLQKSPIQQLKVSEEEPFQIVYNARNSRNSKSRKGSFAKISDIPTKLKKPRKMTLPIECTHEFRILQDVAYETYSEQNFPLDNEQLAQQPNQTRQDINSMDLEKGIQCGIVEESELDKQSWFGVRNENPEFDLLD